MANVFVLLLFLTFALKTSTCEGVRLAHYIPTLQEYSCGRDDLIERYLLGCHGRPSLKMGLVFFFFFLR